MALFVFSSLSGGQLAKNKTLIALRMFLYILIYIDLKTVLWMTDPNSFHCTASILSCIYGAKCEAFTNTKILIQARCDTLDLWVPPLLYSDAQFELQSVVLAASTCLEALIAAMGLALELFVRTSKGTFWWVFFLKGLKLAETKHLGFKSFFFLFLKLWVSLRPSSTRPPSSTHWASCLNVFTRKEGAIRRGLESRSEDQRDLFVYSQKVLFVLPALTMAQFFSSSSLSIGLLLLLVAYTAAGKGCNCASGFELHQSVGQWSVGADSDV